MHFKNEDQIRVMCYIVTLWCVVFLHASLSPVLIQLQNSVLGVKGKIVPVLRHSAMKAMKEWR